MIKVLTIGVMFLLLSSCGRESDEVINQKFHAIIKSDLEAIVEGLDAEKLLAQPYDTTLDWESYEKGIYSRRAIVEFYFYKEIPLKIVRKYRYSVQSKMWERYVNQYLSVNGHLKLNEKLVIDSSVVMPAIGRKGE